jgi:hypothetical protein
VPRALRMLVEQCWSPDAEQRPEFTDVIKRLEAVVQQMPIETPFSGGYSRQASTAGPNSSGDGGGCCSVQ